MNMMNKIKKWISKYICLHDWERMDGKPIRPNELIILQCNKCGKMKFESSYIDNKRILMKCKECGDFKITNEGE